MGTEQKKPTYGPRNVGDVPWASCRRGGVVVPSCPPHEQLLAAVVMGVVGCSSSSCRRRCPPHLPGVSSFGHRCRALAVVVPVPSPLSSPSPRWSHPRPLIGVIWWWVPSSLSPPLVVVLSLSLSLLSCPCFPLVIILLLWFSSHCHGPPSPPPHLPVAWLDRKSVV